MRERLAGLGFIAVLLALVALCVGAYAKVFTPVVGISVQAGSAGLQMSKGADVKLHGVLVGEVREISSTGDGAELALALDPASAELIPGNVTARLLPKTVFGEKYVELRIPATGPSDKPIGENAVIEIDKSDEAVELEEVLDGALPLLRAVPPEKIAVTLSSIAAALDGRGEDLGEMMVELGEYVGALNEEMPTIQRDLQQLAQVLDNYRGALPDLITVLENLTVTNETITDQETELKALWMSTYDFSDETRVFLDRYQGRLVQFGEVTEPVLQLLATYSPEYPCLFDGLVTLEPRIEETFSTGRLHITLEITRDNGKYEQARDEPAWLGSYGPDCRGLPNPNTPGPERQFGNGYDYDGSRTNLPLEIPGLTGMTTTPQDTDDAAEIPDDDSDQGAVVPFDARMGYAGTAEERDVINPIVAASTGQPVDDISEFAALLWGPMLRGATLSARLSWLGRPGNAPPAHPPARSVRDRAHPAPRRPVGPESGDRDRELTQPSGQTIPGRPDPGGR